MTDEDKALVERLAAEADNFKVAREVDMRGMLYRAADRIEALSAEKEAARIQERAAIVAWLRVLSNFYADAIEAGEHLK